MSRENRSVFGDLNARNESEVIDNIYGLNFDLIFCFDFCFICNKN
jgi:hypothetical protein